MTLAMDNCQTLDATDLGGATVILPWRIDHALRTETDSDVTVDAAGVKWKAGV